MRCDFNVTGHVSGTISHYARLIGFFVKTIYRCVNFVFYRMRSDEQILDKNNVGSHTHTHIYP